MTVDMLIITDTDCMQQLAMSAGEQAMVKLMQVDAFTSDDQDLLFLQTKA